MYQVPNGNPGADAGVDQRPFPDVILRSQFFELVGPHSLSSEQRLMLAVLADAINIVQDCHGSVSARKKSSRTSTTKDPKATKRSTRTKRST